MQMTSTSCQDGLRLLTRYWGAYQHCLNKNSQPNKMGHVDKNDEVVYNFVYLAVNTGKTGSEEPEIQRRLTLSLIHI